MPTSNITDFVLLAFIQTALAPSEEEGSQSVAITELDDLFNCPITYQIMNYPMVAEDGNAYESSAITKWFATNSTSPLTNQRIGKRLIPHHALRSAIHKIHGVPGVDVTGAGIRNCNGFYRRREVHECNDEKTRRRMHDRPWYEKSDGHRIYFQAFVLQPNPYGPHFTDGYWHLTCQGTWNEIMDNKSDCYISIFDFQRSNAEDPVSPPTYPAGNHGPGKFISPGWSGYLKLGDLEIMECGYCHTNGSVAVNDEKGGQWYCEVCEGTDLITADESHHDRKEPTLRFVRLLESRAT